MAIGRISGSVLKSNLTRNGVDLAFETNLLYLDVTNSRVGIGTSEPATTFHVNGTIRGSGINVNNAYTLPTSDGSAGQQLTTDGSGTVTWADKDGSADISIAGNEIKTTTSNSNLELSANGSGKVSLYGAYTLPTSDGSANQVLGTDGSGTLSFVNNTIDTEISDDTTIQILNKTGIRTTATTFDSYATGSFDSCLYYVVSRDEVNGQIATQKVLTVHNNTTPFVSTSGITRSDSTAGQSFDAAISTGTLSLQATGNANVNSLSVYKISLGDNSSAATSGNTKVIINADVDSAIENLDTFTHASHRGAKYFISVNDTTDNELEAIECMVVHNGNASKIVSYNSTRTGSTSLIHCQQT